MGNKIEIKHLDSMRLSREFFLLQQPKEVNVLFFTILAFFAVTLVIIIFARIDDVVKVTGIVRTQENVSSVKNVVAGQIVELNYKLGQKVKKGDILYKIDGQIYESQREILLSEKSDIDEKLEGVNNLIESFGAGRNLVPKDNTLFYSRFEAFKSMKAELEHKVSLAKYLYEEAYDNPIAIRSEKNINLRKIEYDVAVSELDSYTENFISELHSEKTDYELKITKLTADIQKLDNQFLFLNVCSPIDGFVQENSSLNVGDYLEANVKVLNIIPNDLKNFRVELPIPPKDMGKLHEGLKVKYRLTAFPYFEYKGAEGIITSIDPDIRSESMGENFFYIIYADIDRTEFSNRHGELFPIKAGLETNARIVLERSTILFYILRKLDFLA